MYTVTSRIRNIKQPQLGYIPVSALNVVKYSDNNEIKEVNPYYKSIQGMAVDYLTRYMTGTFKQYSVSNVSNGR